MSDPSPVPTTPGTTSAPQPPSRSRTWPRRALRWSTGVLVVFALGLGATWLAQVRPLQLRVQTLEQERAALESQVAELQKQVTDMEAIRAENVNLKAGLAKSELHRSVLQAMAATSQAQVALAAGPASGPAADLLGNADAQLAVLEQALAGSMQEDVRGLRERLALAARELMSDPFAAQRDLEVLANGLLNLEKQLSGE